VALLTSTEISCNSVKASGLMARKLFCNGSDDEARENEPSKDVEKNSKYQ
jgi:hypothetical protein